MKRAKCKQCGREAMVAVDYALADATMQGWDDFEGHPCVYAECAYCGEQQHCTVREEAWRATYEADMTRRLVADALQKEREKVARLQEGRW